jgi:hypothetical protein
MKDVLHTMKHTLPLLTALLLAPLAAIPSAFAGETPRVDAAGFGFSPSAAPGKNVAALQKALDGGRKTVAVTQPGVYDLDATLWLDSDTRLQCSPGVVFRKASRYSFVLANRGIRTREWNERVVIDGLEIAAVEGLGETLRTPGLREVMIEIEQGKSEEPVQKLCEAAGFERVPNPLTIPTNGAFNARFVKG